MIQKGRDANPATHKPTAPEEGKNLLLQDAGDTFSPYVSALSRYQLEWSYFYISIILIQEE